MANYSQLINGIYDTVSDKSDEVLSDIMTWVACHDNDVSISVKQYASEWQKQRNEKKEA